MSEKIGRGFLGAKGLVCPEHGDQFAGLFIRRKPARTSDLEPKRDLYCERCAIEAIEAHVKPLEVR